MTACVPVSRYARDDIMVRVIFFREEEEYSGIGVVSGGVVERLGYGDVVLVEGTGVLLEVVFRIVSILRGMRARNKRR